MGVRRHYKSLWLLSLGVGLIASLLAPAITAQAAAGDIATCQQLQSMTSGGSWRLTNDIDCSSTVSWNNGAGFMPLGNGSFTPNLDGQGHTISGLYINRPSTDNVGLFGNTSGGSVTNIRFRAVDITGNDIVGSLGGLMDSVSISNVLVDGKVQGHIMVGGLLGYLSNTGTISKIITDTSVAGSDTVGGVIGIINTANLSDVTDVINTGTIVTSGNSEAVGGIVGQANNGATIANAMNVGSITTDLYAGGIVGYLVDIEVRNSLSLGHITSGSNSHGGIAGLVDTNGAIHDSYWSTGDTGESSPVGVSYGAVNGGGSVASKSSYYHTSTEAPLNAWDFNSVWQTAESSLPQLRDFSYLNLADSLPDGQSGIAYSQSVVSSEGHGPVTYDVSSGTLPAGIYLNTSTGLLSGTPTTAGTYAVTITAQDHLSSISRNYVLDISSPYTAIEANPFKPASPSARFFAAASQAALPSASSDTVVIADSNAGIAAASVKPLTPVSKPQNNSARTSSSVSWLWLLLPVIAVLILLVAWLRRRERE